MALLRREQPALRDPQLRVEPLPGAAGDQGLRLRRGDPADAGVVVLINRSRTAPLPLTHEAGARVLWPPDQAGDRAPAQLEPQRAVVVAAS